MSDATPLEFAGSDEDLERQLLAFARATRGAAVRDRGTWRLSSGALLSTNPNTIRWTIEVRREGGTLRLSERTPAAPWARAKARRIAAFRRSQLEELLRGRGAAGEFREPFAAFGADPASIAAGVAWSTAGALAAMLAAAVAASFASLPLMLLAAAEVLERAGALRAAGALALPNEGHPPCAPCAAFVFAAPLAFLAGVVHWAALQAAELWTRADRLPQSSFLFLALMLAFAFFPFTPLLALPLAVAVPAAVHAAYTMVWGRRRERRRDGAPARRGFALAGAVMAIAAAVAFVPRPTEGREFTDRLALFRDRFMLGSGPGKAAAATYYAHTLTSADPLMKHFFSLDEDERPARLLRTARTDDPRAAEAFRALHFATVPAGVPADVRQEGGSLRSGSRSVPWNGDAALLPRALDDLAQASFRGTNLRGLYGVAWRAVVHAGPLWALLFPAGAFGLLLALLLRTLRPRTALIATGAVFVATLGTLALVLSGEPEGWSDLQALRNGTGPDAVATGLSSKSPAVRHEAAFRAALHPDAALAPALLRAADDADLRVRLWSVAALGATRSPAALPKLLERLDDPELFVRYRAAEGLGFLARPEAVEPLLRMARERSWYEGLYAAEALRKIDPRRF